MKINARQLNLYAVTDRSWQNQVKHWSLSQKSF